MRKAAVNLGVKTFPTPLAGLAENFSAGPLRCASSRRSKELRRERQEKSRVAHDIQAMTPGRQRRPMNAKTEERQRKERRNTRKGLARKRHSSGRAKIASQKRIELSKSVESTPNTG